MNSILELLAAHGYVVLFAYILASQLGAPLPAAPLIVAAGALVAAGRIAAASTVAVVVLASLCADTVWYHVGRRGGSRVLRFFCRISLEPGVCVSWTQGALERYGPRFLVVAKFVPGLGLMAAPIAGQAKVPYRRFALLDGIGALTWASSYTAVGVVLGRGIERYARLARWAAPLGGLAVVTTVAGLLVARLVRRARFRANYASERIRAVDLKARLDRGEPITIIDLRHPIALGTRPESLPGALHLLPDQVIARKDLLPRDHEIVLFCDCPGEASAAQVAEVLKNGGVDHAHPLEGGFEGWRSAGYPVTPLLSKRPTF